MRIKKIFKKIINESVTVELKNGTIIHGFLIKIDTYMNLYLKNAKRASNGRNSILIPTVSIRGTKIRYIVLPNWLNFDSIFSDNEKYL